MTREGGTAIRTDSVISLPALIGLLTLLLLPLAAAGAGDPTPVTVRTGNHHDFGRVVFDASPRVPYRVVRDGDRLTVRFADDVALQGDPRPPRNVAALHTDGDRAELTIAAGSTFHDARFGDHVVIDVFDPRPSATDSAPASPAPESPSPAPRQAPATVHHPARVRAIATGLSHIIRAAAVAEQSPPAPVPLALPPRVSDPPPRNASGPPPQAADAASTEAATGPVATDLVATGPVATGPVATGPVATGAVATGVAATGAVATGVAATGVAATGEGATRVGATGVGATGDVSPDAGTTAPPAEPAALVATPATLPPNTKGAAFTVPFPNTVGAAVFSRHDETDVVFDQRRPIDMTALRTSAAFAAARVELLPAGTLIHIRPPPGTAIALSRSPQGWIVAALFEPPQPQPLEPEFGDTVLSLKARGAGTVLTIADPATGGTLLVGTQVQAGQAVLTPCRTAQFMLLPTAQGVVVAPLADTVALHAVATGFALTTAPAPLAVSRLDTDLLGDAAALTRRFDFPNLPDQQLTKRLSQEIDAAAQQPLLGRGPMRRAAAITMISLGMDAEAEALLQLTAADDPRQAASADVVGLTGVAALLAGRTAEAGGIDDPRLTGTDEIVLWRALYAAARDETSQRAAGALAGTAALLLTYPPAIRDRMLPLAVETMVRGGAKGAATELLARSKGLSGLDLARAMLAQTNGDTAAALAGYDALAAGNDRLLRARAAERAVALRLATGKFDARQAAEAYDRLLYAWRGDRRELALRETLAGLRQKLGEWNAALTLLRDSETLFPDDVPEIRARLQATFDALLHNDAADKLPPLEFVALVDGNADLVPNTREGEAMEAKLADRLLALDLPKRAGPVLEKLMRTAPAGPGRGTVGARLAALRLREGDVGGALAALAASDAPGLPAALNQQRVLLHADAQAQWGDVPGAINTLAGLDSVAAAAARADILERAKDWMGADHALAAYAAKTVPEAGDLNDAARRTLLRLATAAARAGDEATLTRLHEHDEPRMGSGPLSDMFRLLTADPVLRPADLPRSAREVGIARALPVDLRAMRP